MKKQVIGWALAGLMGLTGLASNVSPAVAQAWPTKTVRVMVPFGPGSTPDILARVVAERLQAKLGQPFVIENKAGASGNLGTDAVAKADPDGYTIGVSIGGPLAINTLLFSKLPYNPETDLTAVTQLVTQPSALAVPASLGINTVQELIDAVKKDPGKYTFGSIGNGSVSHLAYQSSPVAMTSLIRGDVQMSILPAIAVTPHAESGAVKILAVTTAKRSSILPKIPTLKETGIDVEADAWVGLIAPAKTPDAIVTKLRNEVVEALNNPEVKAKLATQIMEPVGSTPAEFRNRIRAEIGMWQPVIKAIDLKVN
jgi:tripartite-type tricarboxylate transporter receptor subunit TctC